MDRAKSAAAAAADLEDLDLSHIEEVAGKNKEEIHDLLKWNQLKKDMMNSCAIHVSRLQGQVERQRGLYKAFVNPLYVLEELTRQQQKFEEIDRRDQESQGKISLRGTETPDTVNSFRTLVGTNSAYTTSLSLPDSAVVPLDSGEAYPVNTQNQLPIWEKLEGEPKPYYALFKQYVQVRYSTGTRSLQRVRQNTGVAATILSTLSRIYHWKMRAAAYDAYRDYIREQERHFEVLRMMGTHQKTAQELFEMCTDFIGNNSDSLDPKTALEWFKTAVELERLSLGLDPKNPVLKTGQVQSPNIAIFTGGPGPGQSSVNILGAGAGAGADKEGTGSSSGTVNRLNEIIEVLTTTGILTQAQMAKAQKEAQAQDIIDAQVTEIEEETLGPRPTLSLVHPDKISENTDRTIEGSDKTIEGSDKTIGG